MQTKMLRALSLLALMPMLLSFVACGGGVARDADVSNGDYYSAEEFEKLSDEQREAYCASLDAELAQLEGTAADASSQANSARSELSAAQSEIQDLEQQANASQGEVDALNEEIGYYENLPTTYVVRDGDFLQKISGYEEIYADPTKWTRIYFANRDMLLEQGPNWIYPDWELAIPRDWPNRWMVRQDEYLGRIAGYWEIYDDATQWTRIYEANRNQINDPDMIWPGWELDIPRD